MTVAGDFGKLKKYPWQGDIQYSYDKSRNKGLNAVFYGGKEKKSQLPQKLI